PRQPALRLDREPRAAEDDGRGRAPAELFHEHTDVVVEVARRGPEAVVEVADAERDDVVTRGASDGAQAAHRGGLEHEVQEIDLVARGQRGARHCQHADGADWEGGLLLVGGDEQDPHGVGARESPRYASNRSAVKAMGGNGGCRDDASRILDRPNVIGSEPPSPRLRLGIALLAVACLAGGCVTARLRAEFTRGDYALLRSPAMH